MAASEVIVAHARCVQWTSLPDDARLMLKTFLHDTLAVGTAGAATLMSTAVLNSVGACGQHSRQLILGRGQLPMNPGDAAFINAFQIHAQEFDAVHEAAVVHPMATIAAVLLADAGRGEPVDGATFLAALSVGVDVATGLGLAATMPLKFFRPATAGIFGSVAALIAQRRLDEAVGIDALGLALAFASGTMQAHLEGIATLPIQIAAAARSSLAAVSLAEHGVPGPQGAIDGPFGYLALFEDASALEPVLADLSGTRRIVELSWKPFPTGRAAHGAIVATQLLMRDHGVHAENLRAMVYEAPPLIGRLVGRPAQDGMTQAYARLCLPYLVATVLRRGTVGLDDYSAERLTDATTLMLARRITVTDSGNLDPAAFVPARAVAMRIDGGAVEISVDAQFGSPAWPLSAAQHRAKVRSCLDFAGYGDADAPLAALMANFETMPNAAAAISAVLHRPTH